MPCHCLQASACSQAFGAKWHRKKSWGSASFTELMGHLLSRDREKLLSTDSRRIAARLREADEIASVRTEDDESDLVQLGLTSGGKGRKKRRLRSRNAIVDQWLEEENGDDAFADLEDFIAEDEIEYNMWGTL